MKFVEQTSREVLQEVVGVKRDSRKKQLNSIYGQVEIPKYHLPSCTTLSFMTTPSGKEKCVYMGQQQNYRKNWNILSGSTEFSVGLRSLHKNFWNDQIIIKSY
ncbi:MAG: hypothetical protein AAF600_15285 [Bacteroidota bacterium]